MAHSVTLVCRLVCQTSNTQRQPVPHLTFAEYIRLAELAPGNYITPIETKDMVT